MSTIYARSHYNVTIHDHKNNCILSLAVPADHSAELLNSFRYLSDLAYMVRGDVFITVRSGDQHNTIAYIEPAIPYVKSLSAKPAYSFNHSKYYPFTLSANANGMDFNVPRNCGLFAQASFKHMNDFEQFRAIFNGFLTAVFPE